MRFKVRKAAGVATAAAALIWATGSMAGASVSTDGYYYNDGDTVQITGDQMTAGENVTVDVNLPDGSLSQEDVVVADANGDFSDSYTIAVGAPGGVYSVVATGQSSGSVFTTTFDPCNPNPTGSVGSGCSAANLTATANDSTSIDLAWTDQASDEDGFIVQRSADGSTGWATIDTTAANVTSDSDTDVTCGETWYYRVQSFKDPGASEHFGKVSNLAHASTDTCGGSGPTARAGGPYSGLEGSAIALDGSASSGAGLTYAWSVTDLSAASDDSPGNAGGPACTFDDATSATPNLTCNDDSDTGSFQVTLTVTDANDLTDTDAADVTVTNVAPVVDASTSWTVTHSNCSVNLSAGFADAGLNDTHSASIDWGDGNTTLSPTVTEETSSSEGSASSSHTYTGPGTYSINVTVTDDDGGIGLTPSAYVLNNNPTVLYPLPPIMTSKTFNTGSTVPVKVSVVGCTSNLHPTISVTPTVTTVKSSGKSNLLDQLRYTADLPGFIYNWNTKGWTAQPYTVAINGLPGGQITAAVTLTK